LLIAFYAQPGRFHQIYLVGSAIYLVCIMAFATSGAFGLSAIFLWLAGFGVAGFASMQSALIIANSPPEIRNRTMGVLTMCIGIGPLGILVVGTLAENFGAATGVLINSGTGLIALIVCAILWPEMRRLRATE